MQNLSTGFIAGAGTVNDRVFLFRNERRVLKHFFRGNPFCARDDLRVRQQVERLANIKQKYLLISGQQRVECLRCDAVLLHLTPVVRLIQMTVNRHITAAQIRSGSVSSRVPLHTL